MSCSPVLFVAVEGICVQMLFAFEVRRRSVAVKLGDLVENKGKKEIE